MVLPLKSLRSKTKCCELLFENCYLLVYLITGRLAQEDLVTLKKLHQNMSYLRAF